MQAGQEGVVSRQGRRVLVVVGIIALVAVGLGLQGWLQNRRPAVASATPEPGKIHLFMNGRFVDNLEPAELTALPTDSFVDAEQGKTQQGPRLQDIILFYLPNQSFPPDAMIQVSGVRSSSGEQKTVSLPWSDVQAQDNHVLFDFSNAGDSCKLVSTLSQLDTRDEWVQGVQRIDVTTGD